MALQVSCDWSSFTILTSDWLPRNSGSPITASPAMQCGRQTYKSLSDIVDRFASDQQYWSGNNIHDTSHILTQLDELEIIPSMFKLILFQSSFWRVGT